MPPTSRGTVMAASALLRPTKFSPAFALGEASKLYFVRSHFCATTRTTLLQPRSSLSFSTDALKTESRLFFSSGPGKHSTVRPFTTSTALAKKGGGGGGAGKKSKSSSSREDNNDTSVDSGKASQSGDAVDPNDFSGLESGISKALDRLKDALVKTRNAGRVSVEMIEGLPVEIKENGGGTVSKVKLGDVATVVPKGGRMVQVYAQEEGHVKALTSALLSSPYSLTPETSASSSSSSTPSSSSANHNPLILNVPIPPATAETRQQAATEAKKSLERAMQDIRTARGDAQKHFRKMELGKLVQADQLRRAHAKMEDVVKKGEAEAKKVLDAAVKALER